MTNNSIELPDGYHPTEEEEYMSPLQREYFRRKLMSWRVQLVDESKKTLSHLREDRTTQPEIVDRGRDESYRTLELRTRDRYRKLIHKIDQALARIHDGSYGYCEETGEEIGLKRLEARPVATLSIEAQEQHEREERKERLRR